jgi:streptogramin lyase
MSRIRLRVLVLIGVVVLMGLSAAQGQSAINTPLLGTVKSSNGKPMEGVAVSVRANGTTFRTTVYTEQDGRYFFPPMAPPMADGLYEVWAQAVGFRADRFAISLSAGKSEQQNFTMEPLQDFSTQLSSIGWMESLPGDTAQDRRAKSLLGVNCDTCHTLGFALQNRFDATGWAAILNFMERADGEGRQQPDDYVNPYIHAYKKEIAEYLTRVRGPDSPPLKYTPLPRPTGEATKIVVTEYDISPGNLPGTSVIENGSDWSLGTPSHWESRAVHDVVLGPGGYVWFTDQASPKRTIGQLDPRTGKVTDYTLLDEAGVPLASHDIAVDQMGNVWFNGLYAPENGRPGQAGIMVKLDPTTGKFQKFPVPNSLPSVGTGLLNIDSKGNVWESAQATVIQDPPSKPGVRYTLVRADPQHPGGAIKLDPKTGKYTFYRAKTPSGQFYGVVVDAEDNAWFTEPPRDRIEVVYASGETSEVVLPAKNEPHTSKDQDLASRFEGNAQTGPPWRLGPRRGAADKAGETVWFGASQGNMLLKIDIRTGKVTEFPMPYPYSFPYGLAVDKSHMVWITSVSADRVFKFNPFTEQFTTYLLPTRGADNRFVDVDNRTTPPTLWLAYLGTNKIARIQFRTVL